MSVQDLGASSNRIFEFQTTLYIYFSPSLPMRRHIVAVDEFVFVGVA